MDHSVFTAILCTCFLCEPKLKVFKHLFIVTETAMLFLMIASVNYKGEKLLSDYTYKSQTTVADIMDLGEGDTFHVLNFLDDGYYFVADYMPDEYYSFITMANYSDIVLQNMRYVEAHKWDYVLFNDSTANHADSLRECLDNKTISDFCEKNGYAKVYDCVIPSARPGWSSHIYLYKLQTE